MRKRICFILSICFMIIIFLFSSREAQVSTQDSLSVGMLIGRIFTSEFGRMDQAGRIAFAENIDHTVRKTAHAAEYAVLGLLLTGSYIDSHKKKLKAVGIPLVIAILYAVSDELHQMFVPGRSCQVTDVLIDSCGAAAGTLAGFLVWMAVVSNKKDG